jgi:hypothetical protein
VISFTQIYLLTRSSWHCLGAGGSLRESIHPAFSVLADRSCRPPRRRAACTPLRTSKLMKAIPPATETIPWLLCAHRGRAVRIGLPGHSGNAWRWGSDSRHSHDARQLHRLSVVCCASLHLIGWVTQRRVFRAYWICTTLGCGPPVPPIHFQVARRLVVGPKHEGLPNAERM